MNKISQIAYYSVIAWIVVGVYCGLTYRWPLYERLRQQIAKIESFSQEERNTIFQGSIYKVYTQLKKTPENTRILYLIPDINYLARAVYFLYPRHITAVSSPKFALQALQEQTFDYVIIFRVTKTNGGIVPMGQLMKYWNEDDLRSFVMAAKHVSSLSQNDLTQELNQNNGALLYKFVYEKDR